MMTSRGGLRFDGIGIEGSTAWSTGILDVAGGRSCSTAVSGRSILRADGRRRAIPHGGVQPPATTGPRVSPPPLAVPDDLSAASSGRRHAAMFEIRGPRAHAKFRRRTRASGRRTPQAPRPVPTSPTRPSWRAAHHRCHRAPDDDHAFRVRDRPRRHRLATGAVRRQHSSIAQSIVAELGPLPMVPVTVAFNVTADRVRGLEQVDAGSPARLVVEACVQRGPADLEVVVLTDPDRAPVWESVKWLPHRRASGVAQVLVALDQSNGQRPPGKAARSDLDRPPDAGRGRLSGMVDDRAAPLRPV